jgi:hypothetical protein
MTRRAFSAVSVPGKVRLGRLCRKTRKSRDSENPASVARWRFQPLQGPLESIRGSAIAFAEFMWFPSDRSETDAPAVVRIFSHQRNRTFQHDRPFGDSCGATSLLDNLVRAGDQCRRHDESQRFCGLEVNCQVKFHGPLDRQVSRLRAI